jgi:hypothetical protein
MGMSGIKLVQDFHAEPDAFKGKRLQELGAAMADVVAHHDDHIQKIGSPRHVPFRLNKPADGGLKIHCIGNSYRDLAVYSTPASHQIRRHRFNLRHVVVRDWVCFAVIPRDGDFTPRRSNNRTKIGGRVAPANTVANSESS